MSATPPRGRFLPPCNAGNVTERSVYGAPVTGRPVNDPTKNEHAYERLVLRTKQRQTKESPPHRSAARRAEGESIEGIDWASEEHASAIIYYNATLVPLGWVPVTKYSAALEQAFDHFDSHSIRLTDVRELIDAAAAGSPDITIPRRKTLVRLIFENGNG